MQGYARWGFMLFVLTATASAAEPLPVRAPAAPPVSAEDLAATVKAETAFAIDLFRELGGEKPNDSVLVAPFSIGAALTMAAEGAVGETRTEMEKTLHLPPGNLAGVHRGYAALRHKLVPADDPPALAAKLTQLRSQLDAANKQGQTLANAGKYQEAQKASAGAQKLADEINALVKQSRPYELRVANALWAEKTYPFAPHYLAALQPHYGAVLFPMDFRNQSERGREQINGWVAQNTNQRIRELIASGMLNERTRLVITNSVFFLGEWQTPFEKSSTQPAKFMRADNSTVEVPLMHKSYLRCGYAAFNGSGTAFTTPTEVSINTPDSDPALYPAADGYVTLTLPYRGDRLVMTLVLPRSPDGLPALEKKLTADAAAGWSRVASRSVHTFVPRFKLAAEYALNEPLTALGMKRAFIDTARPDGAQFDGMTTSKSQDDRLYITAVVHKTFLDVNEKGTEAAAASAVIFAAPTAAPGDFEPPKTRPFTPTFKADHPYLCLIQDRETGAVLFIGRVTEPKE